MNTRTLTLPSGRRVTISWKEGAAIEAPEDGDGPLFADALSALANDVTIEEDGERVDVDSLALGDFHVVRAVLMKDGVLEDDEIEIECRNCKAAMTVRPCAALEIAPWQDGELGDAELDTTLPFGEPIEIPTIALGRVRSASTVTFSPRTVGEARPLFEAFAKDDLEVDAAVVEALGIVALGNEQDPAKIAAALSSCTEDSFDAITDAFLASHYVLRLGSVAICKECGARNDVDAPYWREMEAVGERPHATALEGDTAAREFPALEVFVERTAELGETMLEATPGGADIELVVDDGTPAVDDGGEPLLGGYEPPVADGFGGTTRPPTVTLYFQTFRAMWDDEGPYDWQDEIRETIEHELEHHLYFLRGDDPMDAQERAEIREEAERIVGKAETGRRAVTFGQSLRDFGARTWPLWVIAVLALLATLYAQRE